MCENYGVYVANKSYFCLMYVLMLCCVVVVVLVMYIFCVRLFDPFVDVILTVCVLKIL